MNFTKRLIIATCLVLIAFSGAVLGQHGSALAAGGNSLAAANCQYTGYQTIIGTNGTTDTTFTNTGDCVSYAARGGTLVSQTAAAPCLNGGYATLTSASGSPAFTSEAACVLFVGQNGTLVPVMPPYLNVAITCIPYPGTFTITGSGLILGSNVYYYSDYQKAYFGPFPVDSNGTVSKTITLPYFEGAFTLGAYAAGVNPTSGGQPYYSIPTNYYNCS